MNLELRHLRYFTAVARELSFSRAALKLNIAQPPLSRQIRLLEDELGAELLDRTSRPLRLTPAGRFFQVQAQQVLDRMSEVQAATAQIAFGRRTWYGIGFVPSALYGPLPEVIRRFREAHPAVELSLLEMTTIQQLEALKSGRIDVGFGRLRFDDPHLTGEVIMEEGVVVALPSKHRLSRHKGLRLSTLESEPLLLYPARPRPSYADQVLEMFHSRGLKPNVALEANEMQTAIGLVVAGVGYALLPKSVQGHHREGVLYVPLKDPGVHSPIIMNRRTDDEAELTSALRTIVQTVVAEETRKTATGAQKEEVDDAGLEPSP